MKDIERRAITVVRHELRVREIVGSTANDWLDMISDEELLGKVKSTFLFRRVRLSVSVADLSSEIVKALKRHRLLAALWKIVGGK